MKNNEVNTDNTSSIDVKPGDAFIRLRDAGEKGIHVLIGLPPLDSEGDVPKTGALATVAAFALENDEAAEAVMEIMEEAKCEVCPAKGMCPNEHKASESSESVEDTDIPPSEVDRLIWATLQATLDVLEGHDIKALAGDSPGAETLVKITESALESRATATMMMSQECGES